MKILQIKRMFIVFLLCVFCLFSGLYLLAVKAYADEKPIVIVLDPGHGGSDMGAITKGKMEKELNYRVAMACKKELEKYEGVEVYLTRAKDEEKTLADRAAFAAERKADLVISLHFNASESHLLSGAETYVSSKQPLKAQAEKFALTELNLLEQYGIPIHGNFTRLNDNNLDYYGIIRESASYRIPTVIVEHCYLDVPAEEMFYDTQDDLVRLGIIDATAIAMTYGLRSDELGVDYVDLKKDKQILPQHIYRGDVTSPAVSCEFVSYDYHRKKALFQIQLNDPDCEVTSFGISLDNGKTFSPFRTLFFEDNFTFEYIVKDCENAAVVIGAYNALGNFGYSETLYMSDYVEADIAEVFMALEFPQSNKNFVHCFNEILVDIIFDIRERTYLMLFLFSSAGGILTTFGLYIFKKTGLYIL